MAEVKLETSDGQVRSGFVRELEDKGAIIAIDGQVVRTLCILYYVSLRLNRMYLMGVFNILMFVEFFVCLTHQLDKCGMKTSL